MHRGWKGWGEAPRLRGPARRRHGHAATLSPGARSSIRPHPRPWPPGEAPRRARGKRAESSTTTTRGRKEGGGGGGEVPGRGGGESATTAGGGGEGGGGEGGEFPERAAARAH